MPDGRQTAPDMSPEAIDRRIREVSELRRLGLSLLKARRLKPAR